MGLVRMVRPWNEWLIVWGYDINQPAPSVDEAMAKQVARQLVGDPDLEIELISATTWTVNNMYAVRMQNGRVFIVGDAAHRHPPSNGLGSNTSIQDSFNLAWKLALAVQGKAGNSLLESFSKKGRRSRNRSSRAPTSPSPNSDRSSKRWAWMAASITIKSSATWTRAAIPGEGGEAARSFAQGDRIQEVRVRLPRRRNEPALQVNVIATDGQAEPAFEKDPELHYAPTTWPGARLPHVWVFDGNGARHSTLDITGHGQFTLLTGIGGEAWVDAAQALSAELGVNIATRVIGPRREYEDYTGDWATAREIDDSGCLIVRPDHHVGWRAFTASGTPRQDLSRAFKTLLGF